MDDQRERHLIGDLLLDDVDDVFATPNNTPATSNTGAGSVPRKPIAPAGPVGRPTGPPSKYWPEPPPPYTPQATVPWAHHIKQQEALVSGYPGFHRAPPGISKMPPQYMQPMQYPIPQTPYYDASSMPYLVRPPPIVSAPTTPCANSAVNSANILSYLKHPGLTRSKSPVRTQSVGSDCFLMGMPNETCKPVNPLPKAGLSYRDVASVKTAQTVSKAQPTLQPKNVLTRKISAGSIVHAHHSSSDSQSESGLGLHDPHEEESRRLALELQKEQMHLLEANDKINKQPPVEFQKITRRKGRSTQGINQENVWPKDMPKCNNVDITLEDVSRFELLANKANQMSPSITNEAHRNTSLIRTGRQGNIAEDESRLRKHSTKPKSRRDTSYKRNTPPVINTIIIIFNAILMYVGMYVRRALTWFIALVTDIFEQTTDLVLFFTRQSCVKVYRKCMDAWHRSVAGYHSLANKMRRLNLTTWYKSIKWKSLFRRDKSARVHTLGLEHNIDLPMTGDEAMQRLFGCKGQDAYSILGLKEECTDQDIKHYYKRQAVLVHPDKNSASGANEAFRILAQAFELIGTLEARQHYSMEKASKQIQQMMAQLRKKVQEAMSTMHCDCGEKHRRYPVNRAVSEARFCRKCGEHHAARDNDIWAESHYLGMLWYYMACMDGALYDVTEWARCPKNLLKHMKANSHLVQYRLITGATKQKHHMPNEAELNNLMGSLLGGGAGPSASSASYQPPMAPTGDNRPRKAGRRRKVK